MVRSGLEAGIRVGSKVVAVFVGILIGRLITDSAPHHDAPLFPVWATLTVALTATTGFLFLWGVDRWRELRSVVPLGSREVRAVAAAVLAGSLATTLIPRFALTEGIGSSLRGTVLVATASLGALPAAGTMLAVRVAARRIDVRSGPSRPGDRVADLLILRRLLQRLLPGFGALVALSTLALGASRSLQAALPEAERTLPVLPAEAVLVFGASASLVVGLLYAPATTALRTQALALAEELTELRAANSAAEVVERAERRQQMERLLEADRGVLADLQTGIIILGPLIASAGAAFLPG